MPLRTVTTAPFVVRHSVSYRDHGGASLPPQTADGATACCVPSSAWGSRAPGRGPASDGGERDWLFVGEGRGGYEREYKYVGEGHGSFSKAVDEHGGLARRCCKCCIACVLLAIVATLLWIWMDPDLRWPAQFRGDHRKPGASGHPATVRPIATSATSTSTTPDPAARCLTLCSFDNVTATCRARVQWAADHLFGEAADSCAPAYSLVMGHCASCRESGCAPAGAGCAPRPTAPPRPSAPRPEGASAPYDCGAEPGDGLAGWSEAKQAWCCAHEHSHCLGTAARTEAACQEQCRLGPVPGTCGSHVRRLARGPLAGQRSPCALGLGLVLRSCPQTRWSLEQQQWCCSQHSRACRDEGGHAVDCGQGPIARWSPRKRALCCRQERVGCPGSEQRGVQGSDGPRWLLQASAASEG
ncbi:unnamed protein product [Prorocentrum cordatum]|uniref:Uncharacterized protein n=1 Tax=Prorocentrum cordatum TaxID=2364126 RepID=A0ABN9QEQ6_9DINO|nr:unnamed protein product [Polarella glacialis]